MNKRINQITESFRSTVNSTAVSATKINDAFYGNESGLYLVTFEAGTVTKQDIEEIERQGFEFSHITWNDKFTVRACFTVPS